MDDNTKNIITLCIAGYAAVISTITLIWNITNSILDKMSRIKYVKIPQLKLSYNHGWDLTEKYKKKNIINLHLTGSNLTFPLEMKPESEVILKYPFGKGSEWMYKNAKEKDTFKVMITDTTEKKYKSSKLKIRDLKDCIQDNLTINSDLISQIINNN